MHQFYANILVFVNINQFLYINDQFALDDILQQNELINFFVIDIVIDKVKMYYNNYPTLSPLLSATLLVRKQKRHTVP